jgi:hypothetical protein
MNGLLSESDQDAAVEFLWDRSIMAGINYKELMMQLKNGKKRTPWGILSEYPPPLVRLLAREKIGSKHVRALSDQEVAIKGEFPLARVLEISRTSSWDTIPVGEIMRFCFGCNFDPFDWQDRNRMRAYSRKGAKFSYLKSSPHWKTSFLPLIRILGNAQSSKD